VAKLKTTVVSSAQRTGTELRGVAGRETTGTCADADLSLGERSFALGTDVVWLPGALYSETLYCAPQLRTARAMMTMPNAVKNELRRVEVSICICTSGVVPPLTGEGQHPRQVSNKLRISAELIFLWKIGRFNRTQGGKKKKASRFGLTFLGT